MYSHGVAFHAVCVDVAECTKSLTCIGCTFMCVHRSGNVIMGLALLVGPETVTTFSRWFLLRVLRSVAFLLSWETLE
jgi:hypothetical protein